MSSSLIIFFITLVFVSPDGKVAVETKFANDPAYNNLQSCNVAGQALADNYQIKAGTDNVKVFWKCDSIDYSAFDKLVKKGQSL